jgi:hypothetical protein
MEEKKSNDGPGSHFLMMIVCCAIPIIAIVVLSSMGILGSWGFYLLTYLAYEEDGISSLGNYRLLGTV